MAADTGPSGQTHIDAVSALFDRHDAAESAGRDLAEELHLDPDLVLIQDVDPAAAEHGGEAILVAYVPDDQRSHARDVIGTHQGRHVPLDWVQGAGELVDPETFS